MNIEGNVSPRLHTNRMIVDTTPTSPTAPFEPKRGVQLVNPSDSGKTLLVGTDPTVAFPVEPGGTLLLPVSNLNEVKLSVATGNVSIPYFVV